jgi:heme exporter protein A
MLEATNLGCIRGGRTLFHDLNLSIPPGTLLQVRGPNGSGKTSLLRIICGLMSPERGDVLWNGSNIRTLGEEYAESITYLGHRNGIKEELSPLENLRILCGLAGRQIDTTEANIALQKVGLNGRENVPVRFLSEGQRRRTAVARLLTQTGTLWVLDEVMASLDSAAIGLVLSLLDSHLQNGGIVIVATHQELQITAGSFQRLELAA